MKNVFIFLFAFSALLFFVLPHKHPAPPPFIEDVFRSISSLLCIFLLISHGREIWGDFQKWRKR